MGADRTLIGAELDYPELKPVTRDIIGAAMEVNSIMGMGFAEKVYENALAFELELRGRRATQQQPAVVRFKDRAVGHYVTDMVVDDRVVVEVKAVPAILDSHHLQCLNYLRATGLNVCLLLNFGRRRLEYKRFVHDPSRSAPIRVRFAPICD
jgi:GxxExxY protein